MALTFIDYEIPVLTALKEAGGSARPAEIFPLVEELMGAKLKNHPEEYGFYKKQREVIWKNKTRWAREYLKRKQQLDGSIVGIWKITPTGEQRLRELGKTGKDPDEGKAVLEGIDPSIAETEEQPEEVFDRIENLQDHGDILGARGIVYEPINEQGVVLLFAALCHDLGFRIEGIRSKFPDALLTRRNTKGTFSKCRAEFEFTAINYKLHKHPTNGCDLIICWENDWPQCPTEVLELKKVAKRFR